VLPGNRSRVSEAIHDVKQGGYDWAIFTSANGVTSVRNILFDEKSDARALGRVKIASIGAATSDALERQLGIRPDLVPGRAVAEALVETLAERNQISGQRFVLFRADIGRPIMVEQLRARGASVVDDIAVYETRPAGSLPQTVTDALSNGSVNWITFTSSSTATNFVSLLGPDYRTILAKVKLVSIGPITTQTLQELGLQPTVQAESSDIDGLVQAMLK
jgi:uroporphyrinogen III methyltransferase/synthase